MLLGSAPPPLSDAAFGLFGFGLAVVAAASSASTKGERELALLQKISGLLHRASDLQSVLATALDDIVRLFGMAAGPRRRCCGPSRRSWASQSPTCGCAMRRASFPRI